MPTIIKTKNSVTAASAPTSLQQGEVAINITDKKVWVGNAATTPVQLLGGGADGAFTNISVSSVATFGAGTVSVPSITTTGDTNTGIFFPAADTIAFTEGGVEALRINSSANVGIGTSSPTAKLQVVGQVIGGGSTGAQFLGSNIAYGGSSVYFATQGDGVERIRVGQYDSSTLSFPTGLVPSQILAGVASLELASRDDGNGTIIFRTGSGVPENMRITAGGDVGIGTSAPSGAAGKNLTIYNSSGQSRISFKNNITGNTSADGFQIGIDNDGVALIEQRENLAIGISTNASERVRVTGAGLVGIGTGSPISPLTVFQASSNDAATNAISILRFGTTYGSSIFHNYSTAVGGEALNLSVSDGTGSPANNSLTKYRMGANGTHYWYGATTSTEVMRVDTSARVGIGSTSPTQKLSIQGANFVSSSFNGQSIGDTSAERIRIGYKDGTPDTGLVPAQIVTNTASLQFASRDSASGIITFATGSGIPERMRLDASGNLLFNSGYGSVATAYGCRAWVNFNGIGTVAIRASANVSSITDNATGDYLVNMTTAMPDGNYSAVVSGAEDANGSLAARNNMTSAAAFSSSVVRVGAVDISNVAADLGFMMVAVFR
jgi:hypothetical protein